VKALVVNALGGGFDLADVDIAGPIGREVLVDVEASGLCHTDVLFATNDIVPFPAVLGHEVAGIVAAVGPDVTQFRAGDHVVGSLTQACGACARCVSGRSFQCKHPESTLRLAKDAPRLSRNGVALFQGFGLGGFAERALIHENQLAAVPKDIPFPQAALLGCGGVTGAGSVLNTAKVSAGAIRSLSPVPEGSDSMPSAGHSSLVRRGSLLLISRRNDWMRPNDSARPMSSTPRRPSLSRPSASSFKMELIMSSTSWGRSQLSNKGSRCLLPVVDFTW